MGVFDAQLPLLARQLLYKKLKISTAESCTGGLIASTLTSLAGSSAWFDCGFVTYSNESKTALLGVDAALIQRDGAVSSSVACAMAMGALKHSKADIAVSITGIAGPDGGTIEKPVGTVFLGFVTRDTAVFSQHYCTVALTRQEMRELTCQYAIDGLLLLLK